MEMKSKVSAPMVMLIFGAVIAILSLFLVWYEVAFNGLIGIDLIGRAGEIHSNFGIDEWLLYTPLFMALLAIIAAVVYAMPLYKKDVNSKVIDIVTLIIGIIALCLIIKYSTTKVDVTIGESTLGVLGGFGFKLAYVTALLPIVVGAFGLVGLVNKDGYDTDSPMRAKHVPTFAIVGLAISILALFSPWGLFTAIGTDFGFNGLDLVFNFDNVDINADRFYGYVPLIIVVLSLVAAVVSLLPRFGIEMEGKVLYGILLGIGAVSVVLLMVYCNAKIGDTSAFRGVEMRYIFGSITSTGFYFAAIASVIPAIIGALGLIGYYGTEEKIEIED